MTLNTSLDFLDPQVVGVVVVVVFNFGSGTVVIICL